MQMPFYDYYEEYPLGASHGERRRNVPCQIATEDNLKDDILSPVYQGIKACQLEGSYPELDAEGIWPINGNRAFRFWGSPGFKVCPRETKPEEITPEIDAIAQKVRLHHYFRVRSADECKTLLYRRIPVVNLSLKITRDWFDPPGGVISLPGQYADFCAVHAVPLIDYDPKEDSFKFPNSWGENWGDNGHGYLPTAYFDKFQTEAWCLAGLGINPPVQLKSGIVCLSWKANTDPSFGVHGREIIDASTGDRFAWAFAVRRGNYLDIEELFVWPTHRGKGYARVLVGMLLRLAKDTGCEIRAWVPFADCHEENRPSVIKTFALLGLGLQHTDKSWAGYIGTKHPATVSGMQISIPPRTSSIREQLATWQYTVWYGTNRKPIDPQEQSKGYGAERDQTVHYGKCEVNIPKSHQFGAIDGKWWQRWFRKKADRLQLQRRIVLANDNYWTAIRDEIAGCPEGKRQSLVFLHGFNMTFDQAAERAAQIGFDLKMPGVTAFFSWPSQGNIRSYRADEASIGASEEFIKDFLIRFTKEAHSDCVYLIAHSMGNRGLLRSLQKIADDASSSTSVKFKQIFLAAPDIDVDLFVRLAKTCKTVASRTTLYASPRDRALGTSSWLHNYPRAGITPPVTIVEGVDTIEVPNFNLMDLLGHSYFAEASAVLHDMYDLIRHDTNPSDRQRLITMKTDDEREYWRVMQ